MLFKNDLVDSRPWAGLRTRSERRRIFSSIDFISWLKRSMVLAVASQKKKPVGYVPASVHGWRGLAGRRNVEGAVDLAQSLHDASSLALMPSHILARISGSSQQTEAHPGREPADVQLARGPATL